MRQKKSFSGKEADGPTAEIHINDKPIYLEDINLYSRFVMKRKILILVLFQAVFFRFAADAKEPVLLHTIMLSGEYRQTVSRLVQEFNKANNDIELSHIVSLNEVFHSKRELCLKDEQCPVDIFLGFAGYNFEKNVVRGNIEPIDALWKQENFDAYFADLKGAMTVQGKQYGLPLSYYPWGFFYKKSLFTKFRLKPPQTWEEFLQICETLKAADITPIIIGTKTPFTAASWFSYLNLRLHGLEFHTQLTAGRILYTDKRVRKTLEFWKDLIEKNYFFKNSEKETYLSVLPYLYRDMGGMYLMGNIILSKIPQRIKSDIGFFRFPRISPSRPLYEEAPLDILFIPRQSKHKEAAKKVLAFFALPENLYQFNEAAGYLSPNIKSRKNDDPLLQITSDHLKSSDGFSYFFNRNSPPEMGRPGTKLLGRFVTNPTNIDYYIKEFEQLRVTTGKDNK